MTTTTQTHASCPAWCRAAHRESTIRHFGDHSSVTTIDNTGAQRCLALYLAREDGQPAGVEFLLFSDGNMAVGRVSLADAEALAARLGELVTEARAVNPATSSSAELDAEPVEVTA